MAEKSDEAKEEKKDEGEASNASKSNGNAAEDDTTTARVEKEEKKVSKYPDWPLKNIKDPHENDVLYGRGGGTNHHPGNKRYRKMVESRKTDYINSKRLDKPLVALDIIRKWRSQEPPGRFLKMDESTGLWNDVGDKKAREKTSQALREKAPELRRKQEEDEARAKGEPLPPPESTAKNTRFSHDTKSNGSKQPNKAILARDHSLGREYLPEDKPVTLDGFSWQNGVDGRSLSQGSLGPMSYPPGRVTSMGSQGAQPPAGYPPSREHSRTGAPPYPPPPPPPGDPYYRNISGMSMEERQRSFSSVGRYESWGSVGRIPSMGSIGSMGSMGPPPPMPYSGAPYHRSGSFGQHPPPPPPPPPQSSHRENSMSRGNPLRDATVSMPADPGYFSERTGSAPYWNGQRPPDGAPPPPPPPSREMPPYRSGGGPPTSYSTPPPPYSGRSTSPYQGSRSAGSSPFHGPPPAARGSSATYDVDPKIAQTWSSQSDDYEKVASIMDPNIPQEWVEGGNPGGQPLGADAAPPAGSSDMPRPDMVKRMTSNQNEEPATKRNIKRAALNRDSSAVANALKEKYIPEALRRPDPVAKREVSVKEMGELESSLDQTTLDTAASLPKPKQVDRQSTVERVALAIMSKPAVLNAEGRTTTMDIIEAELALEEQAAAATQDTVPPLPTGPSGLSRPRPVRIEGRLTTEEVGDIMNEPLAPMSRRDQRPKS